MFDFFDFMVDTSKKCSYNIFRTNVRNRCSDMEAGIMNYQYIERREYNECVLRNRRIEVRKQKVSLFIVLVTVTFVLSTLISARFTFAKQTDEGSARIKVFKSIVIYGGDTLTSITDKYYSPEWKDRFSYMHEVSMINHLDDEEKLIAGNYLIVPYYIEDPAD